MKSSRWLNKYLILAVFALASTPAFAGVFISVNIAPPPLPVYVQPACPDDGYLWTPGYWAYNDYGYYWVPGTWVQPPRFGVLWTPGYWGWSDGAFFFHSGYWGPHVGFYGGVNYGYGYGGHGYGGGRWNGGHFSYNTAVNNVNVTNIHNTYVDRTTINNVTNNTRNVSYNGGNGGVQAQPTAQERQFSHQQHIQPTATQVAHVQAAGRDRAQLASVNGGKPTTLAAPRPEAYKRVAQQHAAAHPFTPQDRVKTEQAASVTHPSQSVSDHTIKTQEPTRLAGESVKKESLPANHNAASEPHMNTASASHMHPQTAPHPHPQASAKPQARPDKSDKPQAH